MMESNSLKSNAAQCILLQKGSGALLCILTCCQYCQDIEESASLWKTRRVTTLQGVPERLILSIRVTWTLHQLTSLADGAGCSRRQFPTHTNKNKSVSRTWVCKGAIKRIFVLFLLVSQSRYRHTQEICSHRFQLTYCYLF